MDAARVFSRKNRGFRNLDSQPLYCSDFERTFMRRLATVSAVLLASSVTVGHSASRAAAAPSGLTIEQLIDIKHPSNPVWSADGKHVSFTWDRAGVSKRYVSDLDGQPPH
jgi:hypothetical protein